MRDGAAVLGLSGHPWATRPAGPAAVDRLRRRLLRRGPAAAADDMHRPEDALPLVAGALVALVPDAIAVHRSHGVPDQVVTDTLLDVGRKVRAYGDTVGLSWVLGLMRADVVAVGRLQHERVPAPGGRALHVPEGGRLDPTSVEASLETAEGLLGHATRTCTSWLLDAGLQAALPPWSNIRRFGELFELEPAVTSPPDPAAADSEVARFVFRRPSSEVMDPAVVTPRTSVEHLIVERLRSGAHWTQPRGVLRRDLGHGHERSPDRCVPTVGVR